MSDTLPEGMAEGSGPTPAPKKRVVRKSATPASVPRKTAGRKKTVHTEEQVSSVEAPASSAPETAPSTEEPNASKPRTTVRRKRTVKVSQEDAQTQAVSIPPAPADGTPAGEIPSKPVRKRVVRKKTATAETPELPDNAIPPVSEEPPTEPKQPSSEQPAEAIAIREQGEDRRNSRQEQGEFSRQQGQGFNRNNKFRNNNNNKKGRRDNNRNYQQGDRPNNRENLRDVRTRKAPNYENREQTVRQPVEYGPPEEVNGLLEITLKGFGFLRTQETGFEQARDAIYVSNEMIRTHGLRHAVWLHGIARRHPKGIQLTEITAVNGQKWEEARLLPHFEELKAVNPNKRIVFETTPERYTTRTLDLIAPVGRGQRGLIVAPPRTGKTTFLQHMAEAVRENYEDSIHLMILLVDERPEEVTEFQRNIKGAEVYASSNDGKVRDHCRLAELCIERAKRLVEAGKHVFLLMDSITRLARAYNNADKGSGRTMSGGIDARALEMPRRLFAAARNTRQAGSLTIIATALIETNSRMDDLIFQEFKGTGNMELVLNRRIAEQYIYPAVDILKSGTRREELILPENWLYKIHLIRRALAGHKPVEAMERFLFFLRKYPNNTQMLLDLKQRV